MIYPLTSCFGTFILGAFVRKFPILHEVFVTGFYIINIGVITSFLLIEQSVTMNIILSGIMGFLVSYGYSYNGSVEFAKLTEGNQ